jgi:hypothetical protein
MPRRIARAIMLCRHTALRQRPDLQGVDDLVSENAWVAGGTPAALTEARPVSHDDVTQW